MQYMTHRNIIALKDYEMKNSNLYIGLEFAKDGNLKNYL